MDLSFQHEIIGNIKPYWGFYKTSGQIIGYKEDNDIFFDTITDAFTYLSNEDISSVTGNQYNFTLSNESPTSFNVENVPNGPLFAIYQDTYYNITENNIFSAVNKWRYDYFDALALYGPISEWKLVNVLNMNGLFEDYSDFNEDIGQWNTSTVTNMESMFKGASTFNQDIGQWNTSMVTSMESMFQDAPMFNQDISGWIVSMVNSMESMFQNASSFNQMIGEWNTLRVTSMDSMFNGASSFNQSLYNWNDIVFIELENGDISYNSTIKDTQNMLNNTTSLQYPILTGSVNQANIYYAVDQFKTNKQI